MTFTDLDHSPSPTIRAALAIAVLAMFCWSYSPLFSSSSEFVADDHYYIVDNQQRLGSLSSIWLDPMTADYFPVTVSALALGARIWGLHPAAFHGLNLALFLIVGLLAWALAVRLSERFGAADPSPLLVTAGACTLLLMLHPANVESVAAIANIKELLYVLFSLLALWLHAHENRRSWPWRLLILAVVLAAQLSKGTAVILPVLLFLYAWLFRDHGRRPLAALRETAPYMAASAIVFLFQFGIAMDSGVVDRSNTLTAAQRVGGVVTTLHFAISHLLWPVDLSYDYDIAWPAGIGAGEHWILPMLMLAGVALLIWKRHPQALFLSALIVVPFLPYSNLVPLKHGVPGNLVFYDHYLLFPIIGAAPLLVRVLAAVTDRWRVLAAALMLAASVPLAIHARSLSEAWVTEESLYTQIVERSPRLQRGYLFLGRSHLKDDRFDQAIHWLSRGLEVGQPQPDPAFHQALGDAYAFSGRFIEAETSYRTHLRHDPSNVKTLQNLSSTLIMLRRYDQARLVIQQWLRVAPNDPAALTNLSMLPKQP